MLFLFIAAALRAAAPSTEPPRPGPNPRPRIVIGIMVDQMRWDYLYRFEPRYGAGGFRRLMEQGFNCENVNIDYSPSVTACGHTAVYTGSVPALTGIMGNDWYDRYNHRRVYCTDDSTVTGLGTTRGGRMSPANLLTTTIGDEMGMADNFHSKVVGIALKDRAAILPAGHLATAAFWFDPGAPGFITSTYYMDRLPHWATAFNAPAHLEAYSQTDWHLLQDASTYTGSTRDDEPWESASPGAEKPVFPHRLRRNGAPDYEALRASPFGNTLTLDFAKAAIMGYGLGRDSATDLLAISLSSPDVIGHQYGPYSMEIEDNYLRLDRELAGFFTWLDGRFGAGNYLLFLTADHGVAPSPGYSLAHRLPGGAFDERQLVKTLNDSLAQRFGVSGAIETATEGQLYFDRAAFDRKGVSLATAQAYVSTLAPTFPGMAEIVPEPEITIAALPSNITQKLTNGFNVRRSGDMVLLPLPGWKAGSAKGADHGLVYPYDTHIPLLWMGWHIAAGSSERPIAITDIAPTLAALLHIQAPSGCIGKPIDEILGSSRSSRLIKK